jgi:hypothetical protein
MVTILIGASAADPTSRGVPLLGRVTAQAERDRTGPLTSVGPETAIRFRRAARQLDPVAAPTDPRPQTKMAGLGPSFPSVWGAMIQSRPHRSRCPRNPAYPLLARQDPEHLRTQLRLFRSGVRGGSRFAGLMEGVAAHGLDDDEIRDVSAWYATLGR